MSQTIERDSPLWAEKVLALCNKRSCGTPRTVEFIDKQLKKFFETVNRPDSGNPESLDKGVLAKCFAEIQGSMEPSSLSEAATIIVANTACFEATQEQGGKASIIRQIAAMDDVQRYDLFTGQIVGKCQRLADKVLHYSLKMQAESYKDFYSTKVCAIPELGLKVRIPTASSFYRTQVLQPVSKIFLAAIKQVPALRDGLSSERQAWKFYQAFQLLVEKQVLWTKEDVGLLASDYESSTDYIFRSIAAYFFDCMTVITGLPDWYAKMAKEAYLHDLRHVPPDKPSRFETLNSEQYIRSGVMMGDPITKIMLSLGSFYVLTYMDKNSGIKPSDRKGSITGDDLLKVSTEKQIEALYLAASQIGFHVSEKDTFFSAQWAHYTEFAVRLPRNQYEVYRTSRFTGIYPCFADGIRERLMMRQGGKGSNEKTDPRVGRLCAIAHEVTWSPLSSASSGLMQTAIAWQLHSFGVKNMAVMLPRELGGIGLRVPHVVLTRLFEIHPTSLSLRLLFVAKYWSDLPAEERATSPIYSFLQRIKQQNTLLYNSHLGESRYVNLNRVIQYVENSTKYEPYMVITAAEQQARGINLSSQIGENSHVVTSEKIAEKLYAFANIMKQCFNVEVINLSDIQSAEPVIPVEVCDFPYTVGFPEYGVISETFGAVRSIYLKSVLCALDTSEITHPEITLKVVPKAQYPGIYPPDRLSEFAKYVSQLKGHLDDHHAWANIPRMAIDDDRIIQIIADLRYKATGDDPIVVTNDRALRESLPRSLGIRRFLSTTDAVDVFTSLNSDNSKLLIDTANMEGTALTRYNREPLNEEEQHLIHRYLTDRTVPPVQQVSGERKSQFLEKVKAALDKSKEGLYLPTVRGQ